MGLLKLQHTPAALRSHPSQEGREHKHILMIDMHHIISDGTSIGLFLKDFMALFGTRELPPLNIQYKDYSQWQNSEHIRQSEITREKYWLEELQSLRSGFTQYPFQTCLVTFQDPIYRFFPGIPSYL